MVKSNKKNVEQTIIDVFKIIDFDFKKVEESKKLNELIFLSQLADDKNNVQLIDLEEFGLPDLKGFKMVNVWEKNPKRKFEIN